MTAAPPARQALADGKLLVVGPISVAANGSSQRGLMRLNADGSVDASFQVTDLPLTASITGLRVAPDERIYVYGTFTAMAGNPRPGLARLLPNGQPDSAFTPEAAVGFPTFAAVGFDGWLYVQHGRRDHPGGFARGVEWSARPGLWTLARLSADWRRPTGSSARYHLQHPLHHFAAYFVALLADGLRDIATRPRQRLPTVQPRSRGLT